MNQYELLSEIYKLVGAVDAAILREARSLADSSEVHAVLDALEALRNRRVRKAEFPNQMKLPRPQAPVPIDKLLLTNDKSNEDLLRLFKRAGVRVKAKSKESKQRLAARAMKAIALLPPPRQRTVINDLRRALGIDETEGWIEAIRSVRGP